MARRKVIIAVIMVVLFLFTLLIPAQARDIRPWDQPVSCPKCQSDRVVYILYGEPMLDDELQRALDSGKVELAGCIITPDSKRWECRNCKYSWGKVGSKAGSPRIPDARVK